MGGTYTPTIESPSPCETVDDFFPVAENPEYKDVFYEATTYLYEDGSCDILTTDDDGEKLTEDGGEIT